MPNPIRKLVYRWKVWRLGRWFDSATRTLDYALIANAIDENQHKRLYREQCIEHEQRFLQIREHYHA